MKFYSGIVIRTLLLSIPFINVTAQVDPHFSQYYLYPHYMNPALTGVMDGDVRISGIYRNQWGSITNPFSTPGISADMTTDKNINLGVSLLNQAAGDAGFQYTTAYFSVAYTGAKFGTDNTQQLTFGIQGGFISRLFDPSKLRLDDQWIPGLGYNPGLASSDIFPVKSSNVLDLGAGVFYHEGSMEKKVAPYGGIAAYHINRPKDPFVSADDLPYIPMRITAHGGAIISLSETVTLVPNSLYMQQGTAKEILLGTYFRMYVNESTDFLAGGNYRISDSFSPFAGITFNQWTIGVSYDVAVSQLSRLARGANSFELSLSYIFKKQGANVNYFRCPKL